MPTLNGCPMLGDLEDLYERMREDPAFNDLRRGKNPLVPGEGRQSSGVFIVGEAPGADEVMALRPFVGASGRVLRQLMSIASLSTGHNQMRPNCWLTNAVKYRPPRNRTPTLPEIKASRPYLFSEWALVGRPSVIVTVGATALTAIAGKQIAVSLHAGKAFTLRSGAQVWAMFHPAYGLRGGEKLQRLIETHWEAFAEWLENENRS